MLNIHTRIRIDLNPSKRIRSRIRSECPADSQRPALVGSGISLLMNYWACCCPGQVAKLQRVNACPAVHDHKALSFGEKCIHYCHKSDQSVVGIFTTSRWVHLHEHGRQEVLERCVRWSNEFTPFPCMQSPWIIVTSLSICALARAKILKDILLIYFIWLIKNYLY